MARVFSVKHFSTFMGNMGIYSVGIESVYQIAQSGKIECFASVSREDLTLDTAVKSKALLVKHSCLHLS